MLFNFKNFLIVMLGLAFLPIVSLAQVNIPFALSNELGVEIIPTYPRPKEMVWINISLYTADLNSADITWYQDGKAVLNGKGETRYSFVAGPVGSETKIEIAIKLLGGSTFSKTFTLTPASVDIVWEANSYTPPFYRGRALHSKQGSLKLVAMPEFVKNGKRILPQNLIYEWSNGINVYQNQSGYGKNVVLVDGSLLGRTEEIEVLVTDPVNNLVAQAFVDIAPSDPEVVFYQIDPYYGNIFDLALTGSFDLKDEELQILASPFFFSKENSENWQYEWQLNGTTIQNLFGSRTAVFRKPEGESGRSTISLRLANTDRILQQAENSLNINFKK
jgi:hypothetical protein